MLTRERNKISNGAIYLNQSRRAYLFRVYGYIGDEKTRLFFFIHRLSSREETLVKSVKRYHCGNAHSQVFEVFFLHIKCAPVFIAIFVPRMYTYDVNYHAVTTGNAFFPFINSFFKYILLLYPAIF